MEVILKTGFNKITHSITFQPESVPKGIKLVESGHVQRVEEFVRNGQSCKIRSKVIRQTSVSKTPYSVSFRLDPNRRVVGTTCDCVYKDSGKCKHVAALIHFINHEESLSKTSYEQTWGRPSLAQLINEKYSKGAWLSQMFKYSTDPPEEPMPLDIPVLLEELDHSSVVQILSEMRRCQNKPVVGSVLPNVVVRSNVPVPFEDEDCGVCFDNFIHFCSEYPVYHKEFLLPEPLKGFYNSHVALPLAKLREKFCQTVDQSQSKEWQDFRIPRVSASSDVHKIKVRTKATEESLVIKMLWPNKVDTPSTRYGLMNEPKAIALYEKHYGCEVKRVGVLSSVIQPWICASLDGVVVVDGCILKSLEVKCPSSCETVPVVDLVNLKCNVGYLHFNDDGELDLRKSSQYYTQCQVQMYLSGMSECDFLVYSPVGSVCIPVVRDEKFLSDVILKCEEFYFNYYLPKLYESRCSLIKECVLDQSSIPKRPFLGKDIKNVS